MQTASRYRTLSTYLKDRYGEKVRKVSVYSSFTCPTLDGKTSKSGCAYCEPSLLIPFDYDAGRSVSEQISRGVERAKTKHNTDKVIAYFQVNTNTYADVGYLKSLYSEALAHPATVGLSISTRPDCLNEPVLDLLGEINKTKEVWLEMGLQSSNDETLQRINRGHTARDFADAATAAQARGLKICAHIIFGLPGETRQDMLNSVRFVSDLNVWGVKFHQLEITKGAPIYKDYKKGTVKLLTLDEYVRVVVESMQTLPPETVVHRVSGDTVGSVLVAPGWGLKKTEIRREIERLMIEQDTRQGDSWQG